MGLDQGCISTSLPSTHSTLVVELWSGGHSTRLNAFETQHRSKEQPRRYVQGQRKRPLKFLGVGVEA